MKAHVQLERLVAQIERRGALMDGAASAEERQVPAGIRYPRIFGDLLSGHSFMAFDVAGVRIHGNLPLEEDSLRELLADKALTTALVVAGFSPFGRPANGAYDRVCFDIRGRTCPLDAPVVLMEHEAILSNSRVPRPRLVAAGIIELLDSGMREAEPDGAANGRQPARRVALRTSPVAGSRR